MNIVVSAIVKQETQGLEMGLYISTMVTGLSVMSVMKNIMPRVSLKKTEINYVRKEKRTNGDSIR
jgi:hypothetical protein